MSTTTNPSTQKVRFWNDDKKHRCPDCHAVAVDMEKVRSFAVYECCKCHIRFSRWPRLALLLPKRGVRCSVHGPTATPDRESTQ